MSLQPLLILSPNVGQFINAVTALIVALFWAYYMTHAVRLNRKFKVSFCVPVFVGASIGVSLWYSLINFIMAFSLFSVSVPQMIPMFRYAFPILILSPIIKDFFLIRKTHIDSDKLNGN